MNKWNNKFRYEVASCWLFILSYTTMHGSINIKIIHRLRVSHPPPVIKYSGCKLDMG